MQKSRFFFFFAVFIFYVLSMFLYYNQTRSIIMEESEKNIENMLLSQRALSHIVSDIQKTEVRRLQDEGLLPQDYFSVALLSSTYITTQLAEYSNNERIKLGLEPFEFKLASPNPTNLRNKADAHELTLYKKFNNNSIDKYKEIIEKDDKKYLYYAIAGKRIKPQCLQCHGKPEDAPLSFIARYGNENGFGLKVGELSSIISIKVPLTATLKENDKTFYMICVAVFFVFALLLFISERLRKYLSKQEADLNDANSHKERHYKKAKKLQDSLEALYTHVIASRFDLHGNIIEVSQALSDLSGYTKEEMLGQKFCCFRHPDSEHDLFQNVWKDLMEGKDWKGEVKSLNKDGEVFWVEASMHPLKDEHNITYAFESIMRVITEKKALLEDINIDPLSSLLNRRSFEQRFQNERSRAKRDHKYFALYMIDIDYFKKFNDHYGHHQGDICLQEVAKSLQKSFRRSCDIVFRVGGEEFAVISSDISKDKIINSGKNVCFKLNKKQIPHIKSDIHPYVSISVGIAIVGEETDLTLEEIYQASDKALYRAKENGRNQISFVEL